MHGRVIRPALVEIAKEPSVAEADERISEPSESSTSDTAEAEEIAVTAEVENPGP
jgi:hypothetical protein